MLESTKVPALTRAIDILNLLARIHHHCRTGDPEKHGLSAAGRAKKAALHQYG